jgi:hypothetical protein
MGAVLPSASVIVPLTSTVRRRMDRAGVLSRRGAAYSASAAAAPPSAASPSVPSWAA